MWWRQMYQVKKFWCPDRGSNSVRLTQSPTLYHVAIKAGLYRKAVRVFYIPIPCDIENKDLRSFNISMEVFVCAGNLITCFQRWLQPVRKSLSIFFSLSMDHLNIIIKIVFNCFVVYSTRRFILSLALCYFVRLVSFSPFSIAITLLGEDCANLGAFRAFVRFALVCFCLPGFLFLFVSGMGCGLWLWHSLDFSLTCFCNFGTMHEMKLVGTAHYARIPS